MNFFLNVNIPSSLGTLLSAEGHSVRCAATIGMHAASDEMIVAAARANNETIVTHDLDYGEILAFSGEQHPSVIIFRIQPMNARSMLDSITANWNKIEKQLIAGAIVIIERHGIRMRSLPIATIKDEKL
jgi:predicted nuclease of predicted toxin-antitoxin system